MNKINDPVFGGMEYDHSWVKREEMSAFGRTVKMRIVAEAYTGQDILDVQRDSYKKYLADCANYIKETPDVLLKYYLDHYDAIASEANIPEQINRDNVNREIITRLIRIKTLYFDREGQFGWLCDCAWDEEHGICILLSQDKVCIKEQDYLL